MTTKRDERKAEDSAIQNIKDMLRDTAMKGADYADIEMSMEEWRALVMMSRELAALRKQK